ncbi:hypothetical protein [Methylocella sp.]|uniref:hypothetical protein n=1 Tax=Methylocella sp. TaxID=1978226 RepID=UPI0035AEAED4
MALPTLNVTPGSGATINTLPNAPQPTANSVAVALASDHAAVPVSASALPLPAGAASAANQASELTALANILAAIQGSASAVAIAARSGYVWGGLAAALVTTPGAAGGFAPGDTLTLPALAGVAQQAVVPILNTQVVAATIAAAGAFTGTTGTYTVTGATGTGTKFTASCTLTNGSGITAVLSITLAGSYTVNPTAVAAEPVTATNLTGATLNLKMGPLLLGTPTIAGVYAPTTAAQLAAMLAAQTPSATSGSGSLAGVTVTPSTWTALATQVAAANASRAYLAVRNESPTQTLGLSLNGSAALGVVGAATFQANGGGYEWAGARVPSNAVSVIGQTAFQIFTAWEG